MHGGGPSGRVQRAGVSVVSLLLESRGVLDWLDRLVQHPLAAAAVLGVGIAMLLAGGQWLVMGSVTIARRIGVSTLVIGLTIVAMGTSAPELAFNVIAAASNHGELSFGNIIGSNIANIGLILGVTAIWRPLNVHGRVVGKELPWLVAVSIATMLMAAKAPLFRETRAEFGRVDGVIMLVWFGVFFVSWFRMGRREAADPLVRELKDEARPHGSMARAVLLVLAGLACLIAGGKLTERGAVGLAEWLGLSEALIGLTVVAIATSLPELATAIIASRKGHDDLAVGNVVGSNVFNLLLVLGTTSLVAPVALPGLQGWHDLAAMLAITGALMLMALTRHRISRWEGALLLFMYVAYMTWSVAREQL